MVAKWRNRSYYSFLCILGFVRWLEVEYEVEATHICLAYMIERRIISA